MQYKHNLLGALKTSFWDLEIANVATIEEQKTRVERHFHIPSFINPVGTSLTHSRQLGAIIHPPIMANHCAWVSAQRVILSRFSAPAGLPYNVSCITSTHPQNINPVMLIAR